MTLCRSCAVSRYFNSSDRTSGREVSIWPSKDIVSTVARADCIAYPPELVRNVGQNSFARQSLYFIPAFDCAANGPPSF
jgi:hypothetical protein